MIFSFKSIGSVLYLMKSPFFFFAFNLYFCCFLASLFWEFQWPFCLCDSIASGRGSCHCGSGVDFRARQWFRVSSLSKAAHSGLFTTDLPLWMMPVWVKKRSPETHMTAEFISWNVYQWDHSLANSKKCRNYKILYFSRVLAVRSLWA